MIQVITTEEINHLGMTREDYSSWKMGYEPLYKPRDGLLFAMVREEKEAYESYKLLNISEEI